MTTSVSYLKGGIRISCDVSLYPAPEPQGAWPIPVFDGTETSLLTLSLVAIAGQNTSGIQVTSSGVLPGGTGASWTLYHQAYQGTPATLPAATAQALTLDTTQNFTLTLAAALAGATHNFWLVRTDAGGQTTTYPASEITTPVDPATTVNALTVAAQLALVNQWNQVLAVQAVLDADAKSLGVSSSAYDTAITNLSTALVTAGAPANWATTWPSTSVFYAALIQTTLSTLWGLISAAQVTLQSALYSAAASSTTPCAIGDGTTTAFLYAGGTVKINGVATLAFTIDTGTCVLTFATAPAVGALLSGVTTNAQEAATAAQAALEAQAAAVAASQAIVKASAVANLTTVYTSGQSQLSWDGLAVTGVLYEIRLGGAYATAQILGQITVTNFTAVSDGTYWVTPCYNSTYGTPAAIVVTGSTLVANVVATSDEVATGLLGTVSGGAFASGAGLSLQGASLFDALTGLLDAQPYLWDDMGGAQASGAYEVPATHIVDLGNAQVATVSASFVSTAQVVKQGWTGTPADECAATLWLALGAQDGTWGAWQTFVPGQYMARMFKMKLALTSSDPGVAPVVPSFIWTVDVPDRILQGTAVSCPAAGMTVTYSTPFQIRPNLQVTILGAVQGDYATVSGDSKTGFSVQCFNAGTAVARTIHWIAQAY